MLRRLLLLGIIISLIGFGMNLNSDPVVKSVLLGTATDQPQGRTGGGFGGQGGGGGQRGGGFGGGGQGGAGFAGGEAAGSVTSDKSVLVRVSSYGLILSGLILVGFAEIIPTKPRLSEDIEDVAPPA